MRPTGRERLPMSALEKFSPSNYFTTIEEANKRFIQGFVNILGGEE